MARRRCAGGDSPIASVFSTLHNEWMKNTGRSVAVVGAGVIGQVYAGRLAQAGSSVWLLARGDTFRHLHANGLSLNDGHTTTHPPVTVVATPADIPKVDMAVFAVRTDHVKDALPLLAEIHTPVVVTLVNLTDGAADVAKTIGVDRVILGFPGVGGTRNVDGVTFRDIAQQPTTLGVTHGREHPVATTLREAGFDVDVVDDMDAWLATHTVFIAGVGAAILTAGGAAQLGGDKTATTRMLLSIREGFASLKRHAIPVTPAGLRTIFTRVPRVFSVPYWQKHMRGDLGTLGLEPHIKATQETEFPLIAAGARRLAPDAQRLMAALQAAGFPA